MLINIRRLGKSFVYAWRGIQYALRNEQNFRVQFFVAFVVIIFMLILPVRLAEQIVLLLLIMTVLVLELINTVLEHIIDVLQPRINPYAKNLKDVLAATVFLGSLTALVIGLLIFIPYIF
jgi:undecaprenol kinase